MVCVTSIASDQPVHMRGLIRAIAGYFEYFMTVKLLIEHHLQFQSLKGDYGGSPGSAVVKMSNCWKSHAAAHYFNITNAVLIYIYVHTLKNERRENEYHTTV